MECGGAVGILTQHWSMDPFVVVTAVVALWHEHGVRHLAGRSRPERHQARRRQSLLFYAGLVLLDLSVVSPVDFYADRSFSVHMVQHLLLMFAAPVLIVAGAPWMPLVHGLPVAIRRKVGRQLLLARWSAPLRGAGRLLSRPWVAIVAFNAVMVFWHLPGPFDLAERNLVVHIWLMHGSLFATGIFFWLQFVGSYPLRPRLSAIQQFGALFSTNTVMFFIAVSLGMIATTSVYSVYDPYSTASLSAVGDQHLGAGILWICGDFWCLPAMYRAMRRFVRDDESADLGVRIDRLLRGGAHAR